MPLVLMHLLTVGVGDVGQNYLRKTGSDQDVGRRWFGLDWSKTFRSKQDGSEFF